MRFFPRVRLLPLLFLSATFATPALANHTIFSGSVLRFEADGNSFGPFDGVPDFVDEFDDGSIGPDWSVLLGTAVEAGGAVTLHNPGAHVSQYPDALLDLSTVENETAVANGGGDFTLTSYWALPLPTPDTAWNFQLYEIGPNGIEAAGMNVSHNDADGPGTPAGFSIAQNVTYLSGSSTPPPQLNVLSFDPDTVTGPIVLRMTFDDDTDTIQTFFSFDGGTTFQSPFPPLHIFQIVDEHDILLVANSVSPNSSTTTTTGTTGTTFPTTTSTTLRQVQKVPTDLFQVRNPGAPTSRRITWVVKQRGLGPNSLTGHPGTTGLSLNLKLDSMTQCVHMPAARWKATPRTARYSDPKGAYGPVRSATLRQSTTASFTAKFRLSGRYAAIDIVPPNPGTRADMTFRIGDGADYCGTTQAGEIHRNDVRTFKVKRAPRPTTCPLVACSPSGAFLDEL